MKLFAGVAVTDHRITPHDPSNAVQRSKTGVLKAETWRDLSSTAFLSMDGNYTSAFDQYWTQVRFGRKIRPRFAVGLEGGALGNEEYDAGRGGGFLRFYWQDTQITLAGGATRNYLESKASPYLSLSVYRGF